MSAFDRAFHFVAGAEGGYVNDPHDPGGETKFGISRRAYPHLPIAQLTIEDARALYHRDYWRRAGCERLPPTLAIALFDCAVNQGVGRAKRLLQRAAGVRADGKIGPMTRAAISAADPDALLLDFLSHRLRAYAMTRNASRYMRGWSRRVLALHAFLILAQQKPPPIPTPKPSRLS
jgi:lysozyme family protein